MTHEELNNLAAFVLDKEDADGVVILAFMDDETVECLGSGKVPDTLVVPEYTLTMPEGDDEAPKN